MIISQLNPTFNFPVIHLSHLHV